MRLTIRLGIVALFALVVAGAAFAGLAVGRRDSGNQQAAGPGAPASPAITTDSQIESYLARIQRLPDQADGYAGLGAAYLQKARESGDPSYYGRAEAALEKSLSLDAAHADAYVQLGVLALAQHQFEAGLEYGRRALTINPYESAALGVIGDAQVELGRYDEAQQTFAAMLDLRPDLASFARMSYIRELRGDLPGAIELMQRAVIGATGSEAHAWTQVQLGHLYFNSNDFDAALKEYERTLFQRPAYLHAKAGVARVKAAQEDYAGAAEIYESITTTLPLPEYVIALADVQRAAGDEAAAQATEALVETIDRLFRGNGVNTDVEMALFHADRAIDIETTVEDARRALSSRPGIQGWDALAWALFQAGRYDEALAASDQALRLGSRDPLMRYHAGMIALALGQTSRATSELQLAVSQNPRFSVRYADAAAETLRQLDQNASTNAAGR
ncbi:MAG: tetratricopeptide repeat protein [Dehalococcoidia bacterium]